MNKTKIDWCKSPRGTPGYTWNPLTGCLNHVNGMCKGGNFPCYAYRLANTRLKERYLANKNTGYDGGAIGKDRWLIDTDPFYPRFWPEKVKDMDTFGKKKTYAVNIRKPKGIFVCDMGELFGDWIPEYWRKSIFLAIKSNPQYRFYLLTKQPQNLIKWSPFPDNCWVGVTATDTPMLYQALFRLADIKTKVRYVSIEPFLNWSLEGYSLNGLAASLKVAVDWVIIGAQTRPTVYPKIEWVREIVEACDKAGVKVFLKDNLSPLWKADTFYPEWAMCKEGFSLRQEMPLDK